MTSLAIGLALFTMPAEAGKKSAKSKRLRRIAAIEASMLDVPEWKSPVGEEDRDELELHRDQCIDGDEGSCAELGIAYAEGATVAQDYDRSVALLKKSCESGALKGCTNLGLRYSAGQGVNVNHHRAATLFNQACQGGDLEGCLNLGVSFTLGQAVDQDILKGMNLFAHACKTVSIRAVSC